MCKEQFLTLRKIFKCLIILWSFLPIFNELSISNAYAEVPSEPSYVYVEGTQLMMRKRLVDGSLGKLKSFPIKVMAMWMKINEPEIDPVSLKQEIDFFKSINVNTVQVFNDVGSDLTTFEAILNEFYENNIMVAVTIILEKKYIEEKRYIDIVELYKNHPAVLLWSIGNEWDSDYNLYGYNSISDLVEAMKLITNVIKMIDSNHPISSCLVSRATDTEPADVMEWIVNDICLAEYN